MSTIPYTHWSYFDDRADADECATELNELGLLVRIDPSAGDPGRWLLRASWDIEVDEEMNGWDEAHDRVREVVVGHGGEDDGGESGWLDIETGQPAHGSAADEWFTEGGQGADDDAGCGR